MEPPPLSGQQIQAVAELTAGRRVTEVAKLIGVDRSTIFRWLRRDWRFQAELNRLRQEALDAARLRLVQVAEQAAEVVSAALDSGDLRAALAILRGLGLLSGQPIEIGSEDPAMLREEGEIAEREEATRRTVRSLGLF